jgi:DNA invertase Pin-like site-specific DNA recombinase
MDRMGSYPQSKKAAIYLRVSTDDQTVDNQRPVCLHVASARGLEVVRTYAESASTRGPRPQYDRMLRDAKRAAFSTLVVFSIDRFGRSMRENLNTIVELDRIGVSLVSTREAWLDTGGPTRELLIAIVSWVAEQERARIGERTRAGMERVRAKGVHVGRPRARVDVRQALLLLAKPYATWAKVAKAVGCSPSTLRRTLNNAPEKTT